MYIVIAGVGRLGHILARKLRDSTHQVCLIDKNAGACEHLAEEFKGSLIIEGDATYPEVLKDAHLHKADVLVAATSTDEDNIIICALAKELYNVSRTVARVGDPKHLPLYKHMGVDNPVDGVSIIARVVEEEASFTDVMNLLSIKKGRLSIVRVDIPETSPVANKTLKDISLPANSVLVSILRGPDILIPTGATVILPNDEIIAAAFIDTERDLINALIGKI